MSTCSFLLSLTLAAWYVLAALAGREAWLARLPQPLLFVVPIVLASFALSACTLFASIRRPLLALPLRLLIGLHATRLLGIAFLVSFARAQLPWEIALPAGWGEIAIAAAAIGLVLLPQAGPAFRRIAPIWNWLGLAYLLVILGLGFYWSFGAPGRTMAFARPPVSLHFLFVTPLAITVHLLIASRLHSAAKTAG